VNKNVGPRAGVKNGETGRDQKEACSKELHRKNRVSQREQRPMKGGGPKKLKANKKKRNAVKGGSGTKALQPWG